MNGYKKRPTTITNLTEISSNSAIKNLAEKAKVVGPPSLKPPNPSIPSGESPPKLPFPPEALLKGPKNPPKRGFRSTPFYVYHPKLHRSVKSQIKSAERMIDPLMAERDKAIGNAYFLKKLKSLHIDPKKLQALGLKLTKKQKDELAEAKAAGKKPKKTSDGKTPAAPLLNSKTVVTNLKLKKE